MAAIMSSAATDSAEDASEVPDPADAPAGAAGPLASVAEAVPPAPSRADPVPPYLRAGFVLVLIPFLVFIGATVIYNAPPSPASTRLSSRAQAVMNPFFWQDWQLFGPTPGSDIDLLYLETRLTDAAGQGRQTTPVEVEDAIDRSPRSFPINPTKLPGLFLAFDASAGRYSQQSLALNKLPAAQRAAAQRRLDEAYSTDFLQLQRFLSARATSLYPGEHVLSVRATFKTQAIVPFSQRYQSPQPVEPVTPILMTSWMPFIPGVAQ